MIPARSPVLFGRSSLVAKVHGALQRECVVLLFGPPGVGKSAVARAIAHASRQQGEKNVCWARLVGIHRLEDALASIREAFVHALPDGERDLTLEQHIARARDVLLVLDGAEEVLEALAASWDHWWRDHPAGSLQVLVTTRRDPRLMNAALIAVEPLRTAQEPTEERSPAVSWFFHCARMRGWELEESRPETLRLAERIVNHLGGIPTAIELAAARGKLMGLSGLLDYLQRDLSILEARLFDVSSRQKNFVQMLEQSWSSLDDIERDTLMCCSAFYAPFRIEAFASIADLTIPEALTRVESLVERGLLRARLQEGAVVFDVIEVLRQFVKGTAEYRALSSRLDDHSRVIALQAAHELMMRDEQEARVEIDKAQIDVWLLLARTQADNDVVSMLLILVFRYARKLTSMYEAHAMVKARGTDSSSFALLCMARRFEMLYTEYDEEEMLDARLPTAQECALDGLDPLVMRPADLYGAPLRRASLLIQAGQLDEAQEMLQEMHRGWGVKKLGVRAAQLDLLSMELMLRTNRISLAKRLVRTRYMAMRRHVGAPFWDEFVSAMLLIELLGALAQPSFAPRRVKMTWHASGLDLDDLTWWQNPAPGGYLDALSPMLEWVIGSSISHDEEMSDEATRRERLVALLTWALEARASSTRPDMKHFHALASVWREREAEQMRWFELLATEAVEMCLRHEKLHSVATQLHSAGTLVTIDMQSHRFRVGDASWVSFGHRPKAKLLIEYMIQKDERGDFMEVQADDLIAHIWPDESMRYDSALARLYNLIANLRRLGLNDVLVREKEGYRLSEECVVQILRGAE